MRDLFSGGLLLALGLAGLYYNQEHAIGSARRMGSVYMPMLAFVGLSGVGAFVMIAAMFSGPDPMERWSKRDVISLIAAISASILSYVFAPMVLPFFGSGYNAVGISIIVVMLVLAFSSGFRLIALISASVAIFGLLLERVGFFAALIGTMLFAAAAERDHINKPLGVLGMIAFMLVLCWWIFIRQLDIRVNLWPTG